MQCNLMTTLSRKHHGNLQCWKQCLDNTEVNCLLLSFCQVESLFLRHLPSSMSILSKLLLIAYYDQSNMTLLGSSLRKYCITTTETANTELNSWYMMFFNIPVKRHVDHGEKKKKDILIRTDSRTFLHHFWMQ